MSERLAILDGPAVRPQGYPAWPEIDEADVEAVSAVVRSGQWGGHPVPGPKAKAFGEAFAALHGARHAILMMNGTVTMEVALKALDIGWGDEVIVPALTFAATAYAPIAAGALPVIVDVLPGTWAIDPDAVEAAITPRTRAIIPVHLGQGMADMDRIMAIAGRHGLAVIEDCAHSHGKAWNGRGAGSIGTFGSFSHQSSKILTAGEGGTVLTDDDQLAERVSSIIDCGRPKDPEERNYTFGGNYRLSELHAALLLSQLSKFERQAEERATNTLTFERLVGEAAIPGVRLLDVDPRNTRRTFWKYMFAIDPAGFGGRRPRAGVRRARRGRDRLRGRLSEPQPRSALPAVPLPAPGSHAVPGAARRGRDGVSGCGPGRLARVDLPRRERLQGRHAGDRGRGRGDRQGSATVARRPLKPGRQPVRKLTGYRTGYDGRPSPSGADPSDSTGDTADPAGAGMIVTWSNPSRTRPSRWTSVSRWSPLTSARSSRPPTSTRSWAVGPSKITRSIVPSTTFS